MLDKTIATVAPVSPALRPKGSLRIVIPGGAGHLGRLLSRGFSTSGHAVTVLTRRSNPLSAHAEGETPHGIPRPWKTLHWDGKQLGPWVESLEDADVLINLAGRSVDCRYNKKNREDILSSRVQSTDALSHAIQVLRHPPRLWLNSSTATIYRHTYEGAMDELTGELGGEEPDAPAAWRFSIDVARRWERSFFADHAPQTRKVALRTAMVMSPDARGIFSVTLRLVRAGLGGAWGSGRQFMSWIHDVDFFRAINFLIEHEDISGTVNLAAPNPLPNGQFMSVLRDAWGIRFGLPSEEWMLSIGAMLLGTETELLLKSRRVIPAILQKHGFTFKFPDWSGAAQDLIQRWREQASFEAGSNSNLNLSGGRK